MARKFVAVTRVEHGMEDGSRKIFEPGETVTGLKAEDMKSLYEAGAIEESKEKSAPGEGEEETSTGESTTASSESSTPTTSTTTASAPASAKSTSSSPSSSKNG